MVNPYSVDFDKYSAQQTKSKRLGTENVERKQLFRGAASAGSDAIGGVKLISSLKGTKETISLQLNAEGMRRKNDVRLIPKLFSFRADSGQSGKIKGRFIW